MLTSLIKSVEKSVVGILTFGAQGEALSQGTGFFISAGGRIITNRHVLVGAARAEAKMVTGQICRIRGIVAESIDTDAIALDLENPPQDLIPLQFSDRMPERGERIFVIGNPLGLELTVSDGIVSACRDVTGYGQMVQFTAPTSPGSSGSPVVNLDGQVIGIVTAQRPQGQNLNFAIPAQRISRLMQSKSSGNLLHQFSENLETAEVLYSTGESYYAARDYEKALDCYQKAIQMNPSFEEAYFGLGTACLELDLYSEAVDAFIQLLRINPHYICAHKGLGLAYLMMDDIEEAIDVYTKAIVLVPDDFEFRRNLALAYRQLGPASFGRAAEAYLKAASLKPDDTSFQFEVGMACEEMGQHKEAIMLFRKAIRIDPDFAEGYQGLGFVYEQLGLDEEAIHWYREAIRINPLEATSHRGIGKMCISLRRYVDAIEAYKRAIFAEPGNPEAHQKLGFVYALTGDKESALEEYNVLAKLDECMAGHLLDYINLQ